jgi:hypothetical protein
MNKLFNIAVRATSMHDSKRQAWVASVTPCEAIELIKNGANPSASMYSKEYLDTMIKVGNSRKIWFYFKVQTNSVLAKYLIDDKRHG